MTIKIQYSGWIELRNFGESEDLLTLVGGVYSKSIDTKATPQSEASDCSDYDIPPLTSVLEKDVTNSISSISYWICNKSCTREEAAESFVQKLYGKTDCLLDVRYSDPTGYLWTDETFKIGGHDLLDELESNVGKFLILEIEVAGYLWNKRMNVNGELLSSFWRGATLKKEGKGLPDSFAIKKAFELEGYLLLGLEYDPHHKEFVGSILALTKEEAKRGVSIAVRQFVKEARESVKGLNYFLVEWDIDTKKVLKIEQQPRNVLSVSSTYRRQKQVSGRTETSYYVGYQRIESLFTWVEDEFHLIAILKEQFGLDFE